MSDLLSSRILRPRSACFASPPAPRRRAALLQQDCIGTPIFPTSCIVEASFSIRSRSGSKPRLRAITPT